METLKKPIIRLNYISHDLQFDNVSKKLNARMNITFFEKMIKHV